MGSEEVERVELRVKEDWEEGMVEVAKEDWDMCSWCYKLVQSHWR